VADNTGANPGPVAVAFPGLEDSALTSVPRQYCAGDA